MNLNILLRARVDPDGACKRAHSSRRHSSTARKKRFAGRACAVIGFWAVFWSQDGSGSNDEGFSLREYANEQEQEEEDDDDEEC